MKLSYEHDTTLEQNMNLDALLDEYKESARGKKSFRDGVEDLDFTPEAYVVFTKENVQRFREDERHPQDLDEWMDSCAQGQCAPILSLQGGSRIEALWCFENGADALMFKLQFCS